MARENQGREAIQQLCLSNSLKAHHSASSSHVALVVEPDPQALLALPNASRLHQLAYVVLRSIAVYTYQIACQHIRAYRIDEKAE